MSDFKVVLPTTTEEWQRDMNIAYNQALDDCRKMCGADTPHYTNCIGCPLAHFENDFDTTICKLEQLKKQNKHLIERSRTDNWNKSF